MLRIFAAKNAATTPPSRARRSSGVMEYSLLPPLTSDGRNPLCFKSLPSHSLRQTSVFKAKRIRLFSASRKGQNFWIARLSSLAFIECPLLCSSVLSSSVEDGTLIFYRCVFPHEVPACRQTGIHPSAEARFCWIKKLFIKRLKERKKPFVLLRALALSSALRSGSSFRRARTVLFLVGNTLDGVDEITCRAFWIVRVFVGYLCGGFLDYLWAVLVF